MITVGAAQGDVDGLIKPLVRRISVSSSCEALSAGDKRRMCPLNGLTLWVVSNSIPRGEEGHADRAHCAEGLFKHPACAWGMPMAHCPELHKTPCQRQKRVSNAKRPMRPRVCRGPGQIRSATILKILINAQRKFPFAAYPVGPL